MVWVDVPDVDLIHPQSNKFVTGVRIKAMGESINLMKAPLNDLLVSSLVDKILSFFGHVCWHICCAFGHTTLTNKSVVISTLLEPERNSFMITSLSFWSMSPCYNVKKLRQNFNTRYWFLKMQILSACAIITSTAHTCPVFLFSIIYWCSITNAILWLAMLLILYSIML